MYLRAIILAGIVLEITAYIEIKHSKEKGFDFIKALIGMAIALIFLSYPLYQEYTGIKRIACTILFAIQTLTLNEDFELLSTVSSEGVINTIYIVVTYILYFVAPLLSATALLSLFGNTFSKLMFWISSKEEYHIFSEINEKTITLANRILCTHESAKIIFMKKEEKGGETRNKHFLKLKEKINDLNLDKIKKKKYLYFMSMDEDENLNESLEFLDKLKGDEQAKIYILNNKPESYMMIDSMMSQYQEKNVKLSQKFKSQKETVKSDIKETNLQVEIVNEVERIVLQKLEDLPIQNIFDKNRNEVTVLIVGCGNFGQAFLKAITWCFQVIGYSLKIIVVEKNAESIIHKIKVESPELLTKYNIHFINEDITAVISEDMLKGSFIDYTVVTAGNDSDSFNIAIALRRYFLVHNMDDVTIDVLIRNRYKNKNIAILKNEKNQDYNINTFGSIEEAYFKNSIIDSDIEKMAKQMHAINCPDDKSFSGFYNSEYNKKSSRASVVHIRYKLYSVLKEKYTGNLEKDIENYQKLIQDKKVVKELAENEHDRWMAYMHTDGYRVASKDALEAYYLKIGNQHKYTLAKLHPALVENKDLPKIEEDVENVIEKLTGVRQQKNFVEVDYEIVQKLDQIVKVIMK